MRRTGMQLVAALGVTLGAALPTAAAGQPIPRPAFEAFYTRVGYEGVATGAPTVGGTVRASGLGGRVLWPIAPSDGAPSLARRTALGLFGAYTPNTDVGFSAGQLGLAADLAPLATPIAGRVEPFLSLGAGALRTRTTAVGPVRWPTRRPEVPGEVERPAAGLASRAVTHLLVAPGAGVRLRVGPEMAVQADVRQLVTVGAGARRSHPAIGTGVRLTF